MNAKRGKNVSTFCKLHYPECFGNWFGALTGNDAIKKYKSKLSAPPTKPWSRHRCAETRWFVGLQWIRFIDDLIIWKGTEAEFQQYFELLNNSISCLKLTYNISKERIVFLDNEIYIKDNTIHTTLHRKKTATNSTLQATSFHQPQLIESIPYGEFLRIKQICSEKTEWEKHSRMTMKLFKNRNYKEGIISKCWKRADELTRDECLKEKQSLEESTTIRFITDYSTESRAINGILQKHWKILQLDETIGKLMDGHPITTYRWAKNLRDRLTHSHFKKEDQTKSWLQTKKDLKNALTVKFAKLRNQCLKYKWQTPKCGKSAT